MGTTPLQGFTIPDLSGAANAPSNFSVFGGMIEKYTMMRFTTAAARNAAVTSPEEGMWATLTTDDKVTYYDGTGWVIMEEAWQSYTPTVAQGASSNIAKTVTTSEYMRRNGNCLWRFRIALTAAGTAGSSATLSVPVAALETGVAVGAGWLYDLNTTIRYVCALEVFTTATITFPPDGVSGNWGTTPNLALASGDLMAGTIEYRMTTRYS